MRTSSLDGTGDSTNITIDNVEFDRVGRTGISITDIDYVTIKGCNFHDYISVAMRVGYGSDNLIIQDNSFHDMWQYEGDDSAVRCHAGDWLHFYGNNSDEDGTPEATRDPHDIIIERNYFYNDKAFNYAHGTGIAWFEWEVYNATFRNNLVMNPHTAGFIIGRGTNQVYFFNNTIIAYDPAVSGGVEPLWFSSNTGPTVEVKNNIIIQYATGSHEPCIYITEDYRPSAMDNNVFYKPNDWGNAVIRKKVGGSYINYTLTSWQVASGLDGNSDDANPNLAAVPANSSISSTGNYYLTSSSTNATNRGTTISSFSDDYAGISRPHGLAWDIGAYEYEGEAPGPPDAPKNFAIVGIMQ